MSLGRFVTYGNLGVIASVLTVSPNVIANAVSASGSGYIDVSNRILLQRPGPGRGR